MLFFFYFTFGERKKGNFKITSIKKAGFDPAFFVYKIFAYECFSDKYLSASIAAIQPDPAAVTA